jgi:DNA repair photolyase
MNCQQPLKGRGAVANPAGRFEPLQYEPEYSKFDDAPLLPQTRFYEDTTKSIISYNQSPDIPFNVGINPYRGCEHGCSYCFARPGHEYLGFSAGLDFETRIFVKRRAAALLHKALCASGWQPQVIAISGNTDPYQPAEKHFRITRECLEVLAEFRNPAVLITKSYLVTRDIDVLSDMAKWNGVAVAVSVTTLNNELARKMEPRAAAPARRLEAIEMLSQAGIPVSVMVAPIIPGLNDNEIPAILQAAVQAGASTASYIILRLPYSVKNLFCDWLAVHFPDRKEKILNRLRDMRGGKLNNAEFHQRMRGEGVFAEQIRRIFQVSANRLGIARENRPPLSTAHFRIPGTEQLCLFSDI